MRSFAWPSCAAGSSVESAGAPKTFSMNCGIDACSATSLKMKPGFAYGRDHDQRQAEAEAVGRGRVAAVLARRGHVVVPAAEVVHREEDGRVFPVLAVHQEVDVLDCPVLPRADRADAGVLVVEVLIDDPGDVGELVIGNVVGEGLDVDDLAPARPVADGADGVEHRPDVGQDVEVRSIELPVDADRQHVGDGGDVEARGDTVNLAGAVAVDVDLVPGVLIAAPVRVGEVRRRVARGPPGLRGEDEGVAREAGPEHVGEEVIAEGEGLGIGPVGRDVVLVKLRPGEVITVLVRARRVLPAVHLAVVPVGERALVGVAEITRGVGRVGARDGADS